MDASDKGPIEPELGRRRTCRRMPFFGIPESGRSFGHNYPLNSGCTLRSQNLQNLILDFSITLFWDGNLCMTSEVLQFRIRRPSIMNEFIFDRERTTNFSQRLGFMACHGSTSNEMVENSWLKTAIGLEFFKSNGFSVIILALAKLEFAYTDLNC